MFWMYRKEFKMNRLEKLAKINKSLKLHEQEAKEIIFELKNLSQDIVFEIIKRMDSDFTTQHHIAAMDLNTIEKGFVKFSFENHSSYKDEQVVLNYKFDDSTTTIEKLNRLGDGHIKYEGVKVKDELQKDLDKYVGEVLKGIFA